MHKRSFFCCYERLILKLWWLLMLWVLWRMITEDCWWKIYSWRFTLWRSCCVKSFFSVNWTCVSDLQGPWKLIIDVVAIVLENVDSHHHTIVWSVTVLVEAILLLRVQWRPVRRLRWRIKHVYLCEDWTCDLLLKFARSTVTEDWESLLCEGKPFFLLVEIENPNVRAWM